MVSAELNIYLSWNVMNFLGGSTSDPIMLKNMYLIHNFCNYNN